MANLIIKELREHKLYVHKALAYFSKADQALKGMIESNNSLIKVQDTRIKALEHQNEGLQRQLDDLSKELKYIKRKLRKDF